METRLKAKNDKEDREGIEGKKAGEMGDNHTKRE